MAAKPAWHARLPEILADLESLPSPWITRPTVEFLLRVGPRRAQQIMLPCAVERIGTSLVADRPLFIAHLRTLGGDSAADTERSRRRKVGRAIDSLRRDWLERPKVLVEAPLSVVNQRFENLPPGVELAPGQITIRFGNPHEALEKMLALAMAAGRNLEQFERLTETASTGAQP